MISDADLTVGQRIEHLRRRQGMSRSTLAGLLGYSNEWLRKVEREGRPVERVSTIMRLADILRIDNLSKLIDNVEAAGRFDDVDSPRKDRTTTSAVRQALLRRQIPGERPSAEIDPGPVADEVAEVWTTWRTFSHCYSATYQRLPALIDHVTATSDAVLRAEAFRLVSSYLLRVGDTHFAQVAVDRALTQLVDQCDGSTAYPCIGQFSEVLLRTGLHHESWKLATDTASRLRRCSVMRADDLPTLVYLRLIAAEAAAAMMDHRNAMAALDEARQLLSDERFRSADAPMGPAAAEIIAMRIELAMGRPERALQLADRANGLHGLCLAGQSEFYLSLAAAHLSHDDLIATTFALMQVERICTEEIRFGAQARRLISHALAEGTGRVTVRHELCGLAERAGIL